MTVVLLSMLFFLVCLGLSVSALYFLVEAPAAKKRFQERLTAVQLSVGAGGAGSTLLRDEALAEAPALKRLLYRLPPVERLQSLLAQAGMDLAVGALLMMCVSLALLALLGALVLNMPAMLALILMAGAGAGPLLVVWVKRQRRFARFEELFPDAIDLLARAVRAGHAFTTGFELIAREMPEPLAGEFRVAYEQQNLGMPLREALENLVARMPIADVRFFVSALQIQRESGGNLAEILDKLSYVIRERFKLLRQVRVYTAEGRMSLYILTAVPPITGVLMFFANREYIMTLFHDPLGHKMLGVAALLQVAGFLVMRQITRLKV